MDSLEKTKDWITVMKRCLLVVCVVCVVCSCQRNPLKIDVSDVEIELAVKSYDDALFADRALTKERISELQQEYGRFFELFNYHMIGVGGPEDAGFLPQLKSFVSDTMIVSLKQKADQLIDKKALEHDFTLAFKHYHYYFPKKVVPTIYTCISGFNQSVVLADSLIGISLDKYLGADSPYYPSLGLAKYKTRNMHPQKIVSDALYFWAMTEYPINLTASKVIENMVYQGTLYYFVDAMMPEVHDTLKIGYTAKQLAFCQTSEAAMWSYLAEQNLLFSTKRMDIKRYVDDGPYTASFTTESPGRVGAWLGWQIVRAYMKKNPEVSLKQLMEQQDYLSLLNQSGYQPN
ncbi:gliding motility lipoprotein GldB [Sunxiuqinia sp. sy24]|uniref:gliding motility lipoprotein GldB n=1 Tax=Sunxiuqinia sp. sy24 TaxID=3461495 RepID=UPI004045D470